MDDRSVYGEEKWGEVVVLVSQWVSFSPTQRTNPAELLRLYLSFDHIEAAAHLAIEHIDAMLGYGKEYFGLEVRKISGDYQSLLVLKF